MFHVRSRAFWLLGLLLTSTATAQDPATRLREARDFHVRATEKTGVLIPLYVYPANIHTNAVYNKLIQIKRRHETVPIWVILNPASGPGTRQDANYTKAIDRLRGAGCMVLGYVSTSYGKRTDADVRRDLDQWLKLYPRIQGTFFDEMRYEDTEAGATYQAALTKQAHDAGLWPVVANPGADTPGRYFAAGAADVIIIHEGDDWPMEDRLKGDDFGGHADFPPFTRGILLHSQTKLDAPSLRMARQYVRWVYVTEAPYRPKDPKAANPWDRLSTHLEDLCERLSEK